MVLNGVHALLEPATLWTEPAAQKPTDNPDLSRAQIDFSTGSKIHINSNTPKISMLILLTDFHTLDIFSSV